MLSARDADAPPFSLVVTTIGRPETFSRLLASLADEWAAGAVFELIVVDQDPARRSLTILESEPRPYAWRHLTSGRGASVGRNVGLAVAQGHIVGFPDDDVWYSGDTLGGVRAVFDAFPFIAGVSGRLVSAESQPIMLRWLRRPAWVTPLNYHRASIGSTLFYRRSAVSSAGTFDEEMGVGSQGWYGSAEESDLLVRVLALGGSVRYVPTIAIRHDPFSSDMAGGMGPKMLLYGAGQGYFWRKHTYPKRYVCWMLLRKFVKAVLWTARGRRKEAGHDLAWAYGAICGFTGRKPRGLS